MSRHKSHVPHTVILFEWRRGVFERIAADLRARHFRVVRGDPSARGRAARRELFLLLVNADQPDYGGWSLIEDLRDTYPEAIICAYTSSILPGDALVAEFLGVDRLIDGSLRGLSGRILDYLK